VTPPTEQLRHGRGFTLIEIMVAVMLLALLATAAALSFAGPLRTSQASEALDQVRSIDATSRQFARRFGRGVQVVFDMTDNTIARREGDGKIAFRLSLPRGYCVERVRTAAGADSSSGECVVECSSLGLTRSYAVHVVGPGLDKWLLFAGLSGQVSVVNDESQVTEIFAPRPSRERALHSR
jgi:prepilin-type N-terminal cleavage/methylation domain-containing protein